MSVGGLDIEVQVPEFSRGKKTTARKKKTNPLKSYVKDKIVPLSEVTAHIDPSKCVNCGTCREICPANAIEENQRIICHVCPACTEKPGMSPQRVDAIATECSCTTACPLHVSPQGYIVWQKPACTKKPSSLSGTRILFHRYAAAYVTIPVKTHANGVFWWIIR